MTIYLRQALFTAFLLVLSSCEEAPQQPVTGQPPTESVPREQTTAPFYKDASASVSDRVEDLISRMTLAEKIAQVTAVWAEKKKMYNDSVFLDTAIARQIMPYGIGHITRPSELAGPPGPSRTAKNEAEFTNAVQKWLVEETRLGIPALMHEESLHGLAAKNATSWNQPIGLAATWNTGLARQLYAIAARQTRSRGGHLVLTPVVDVCREPRWGRVEETFGEDPFLSAEMGKAAVLGFQGDDREYDRTEVLATLKHMTGHGEPEGGNNIGPAHIAERTLHEIYLYPFKRIVKEAKVANIMASYNEVNGVPSHANDWMLNELLRDEWGFDGVVVSDYFAVKELHARHRVSEDLKAAAVTSISSGVDIELPDAEAFPFLGEAVEDGSLRVAVLDRAVGRILTQKFQLGLFEDPYVDPELALANMPADDSLALRAATEGMVMLKNDGLLPMTEWTGKTVAVIGPNADRVMLGGYSDYPEHFITVREGLEKYLEDRGGKVVYAQGVEVTRPGSWYLDPVELVPEAEERENIAEAVLAARGADLIVLAIGGNELTSREAWAESHLGDRPSLELFGLQNELIDALAELDKPTVGLVYGGRPLDIRNLLEKTNAVFQCWYQGQETGHAVANVLGGDANPSGKLPLSMPRSAGHIPAYYNYKPTARRGYLHADVNALFPFGYGLSYTSFSLGSPTLSDSIMSENGTIELSVDVTNTGERRGAEVVQLYVHDQYSSVTRRLKDLRGFQKLWLDPGQTETVKFTVDRSTLEFLDKEMKWTVEPGGFTLMVGTSSREEDLQQMEITVN